MNSHYVVAKSVYKFRRDKIAAVEIPCGYISRFLVSRLPYLHAVEPDLVDT